MEKNSRSAPPPVLQFLRRPGSNFPPPLRRLMTTQSDLCRLTSSFLFASVLSDISKSHPVVTLWLGTSPVILLWMPFLDLYLCSRLTMAPIWTQTGNQSKQDSEQATNNPHSLCCSAAGTLAFILMKFKIPFRDSFNDFSKLLSIKSAGWNP